MNLTDALVLAVVAALLALAVRSILRSRRAGACSGCGSASTCSAHATVSPCPAAADMLDRVEKNLGK